ncbi:hypothetical protein ACP275_04G087200 [Erythranthe tilingii]
MSQNNVARNRLSSTTVHIMALDGTLNVNSLFMFAAFLGIALNPADPNSSLVSSAACAASSAVAKHFVEFHVYSFTSFLFSSLIASCLKLAITTDAKTGRIHRNNNGGGGGEMQSIGGNVNLRLLQGGILASAGGSISGCAFLTAALVDLVEIKLGTLACWGWHTAAALIPMLILVPSALVIYIGLLFYAFNR